MKLVILDGHTLNPGGLSWEEFSRMGELTVYDSTPEALTAGRIGDAEIVLTNKTPVTAAVLDACPRVRYIGVLATGYNIVDTEAAARRGIPVTNVPGYGTDAVAQHTIALLLEVCSAVGRHDRAVKAGRWAESGEFCFWEVRLTELAGKTMGLVGYGSIGRRVGAIAAALGMRVLAHSRSRSAGGDGTAVFVPLEELWARSDVISLHCPLFPETSRLIRGETIARMKDGVILLNTARGGLVDEAALAEALRSGKVRAAAVDVVSAEPITDANPLFSAPNCIVTPHIAWAAEESRARLMRAAAENVRAFLGGTVIHAVNL